jgi:hypothetical protein
VRNEEVLYRVKMKINILHTIKKKGISLVWSILCRNCLLKRVIEGEIGERIYATGRPRRRSEQLPDDLKERRGYWKLKERVVDHSVWTCGSGRGCGPVRDRRMNE